MGSPQPSAERVRGAARALESIHDIRRTPGGARARVRIRIAVVASATEIAAAGKAEIVREARIDVAVVIALRQSPGAREVRHVSCGSAARFQDVAQVVILHQDDYEIIEVRPRAG